MKLFDVKGLTFSGTLGVVILIFVAVTLTKMVQPKEMTMDQFLKAKKVHAMGGFIIEGVVEEYPGSEGVVQFQASNGKTLSTLRIVADGEFGFVSYFPHQIKQDIGNGDSVRVTGRFETVPYYGYGPGQKNRKMTTATLSSIKLLKRADDSSEK